MKTIKSKKSYIDFEDLFDDSELKKKKKKKCKNNKKKNKHKSSSKKSSNKNKKKNKKMKKNMEITSDFFGLDNEQIKTVEKLYKQNEYNSSRSFLRRIADAINIDAKINVDITDDTINNILLIASGLLTKFFTKK